MQWTILAQEAPNIEITLLEKILKPDVLPFMVGALAIVVFGGLAIIKTIIQHRERIAMIQHGIHPDADPRKTAPNLRETTGYDDA